jgi:hypothetical protein
MVSQKADESLRQGWSRAHIPPLSGEYFKETCRRAEEAPCYNRGSAGDCHTIFSPSIYALFLCLAQLGDLLPVINPAAACYP